MQCDICFRSTGHGGKSLHFLCPIDARNTLYEPRIRNAQALLEHDALDQQVQSVLPQPTQDKESISNRAEIDAIRADSSRASDRTEQIIAYADELKVKIEAARDDLAIRKANVARRKSELASATKGVESRRLRQIEDIEKGIRMLRYKWNQAHKTTASSRVFLCGEAAKLYGLKRVRRNSGTEEFRIGGVAIVDLRGLNTAPAADVSTALSHIVHLLMLSTHYLSIRLPAEITLAHRDYPLPTIFPLLSSHKYEDVPFPGTIPIHSSSGSPTSSRHPEPPKQPRPRPLFIHKPLPIFATEDPAGYALFLEGVTLLAYDIAWVCKSQGIPVGEESSFDDVCNIGRNMYNLLISPRLTPSSRVPSTQTTPVKNARDTETEGEERKNPPISIMGKWSHGNTHSNLNSAEGSEFIRSWKLPSPRNLADKLKSKLLSEVANAEWEVLDPDAWAINDGMDDDGVVVGARKESDSGRHPGMQSFISMRTVVNAVESIDGDGERKSNGTSGWTKLKPR